MPLRFSFLVFAVTALFFSTASAQTAISLNSLNPSQKIEGFSAQSVYLNDAGQPMGARFIHDRTGFTFDLLQIESVPQTFIWVNTLPVSDKGEPHTQEHLLITKGNKGHALNTRQGMSLAVSNAFTSQIFTAYNFYTSAGSDVFYNLFEGYMDALLHPNYTDEEVHREVRNWGVAEDAATKKLRLEEKGSVYNEMKTSMNNSYSQVYDRVQRLIYGEAHPLSYNSGGSPEGIRILNAADIKKYHDKNYHLNNMGAITAMPKSMSVNGVLKTMNAILGRLQPGNDEKTVLNTMPTPRPAVAGTTEIVPYPSANEQDPGVMLFAYPAQLNLSIKEDMLLNGFLASFAGDAGTNLYKLFIDSKTRGPEMDAQGVSAYADNHTGEPIFFTFNDVNPAFLTREKAAAAWQKIQQELKNVASYKDGSKELEEFNARFKNNLTDYRRSLAKFTNTPPLFGGRNTGDAWYQQLLEMTKSSGFKKSITFSPQFAEVDAMLASGKNFWGEYFSKWKLIDPAPFTVMAKADAQLLQEQDSAARIRSAEEVARLKTKYQVTDDADAIQKYKAEYDNNTLQLEKAEQAYVPKFIDNPPLTLDDRLDFRSSLLPRNIPLIASSFNNMTGATTGLALKLNNLPQDKLVYLAILPDLLTQTGLYKDGKATSFEDMTQLERKQILSLNAYYSNNFRTHRSELVVKGAGNNSTESLSAIEWMNDVLQHPYWKPENLPRIRDLVNQNLSGLRKRMQGREESWVSDPGGAYRAQDNALILADGSFLTRAHNVQRLRWMLMDAGNAAEHTAIAVFLDQMANAKGNRDDLKKLLTAMRKDSASALSGDAAAIANNYTSLSGQAKKTALEAVKDLEQTLNDLPDGSLNADWQYLCRQMKQDLAQGPEKTLADLEMVRQNILHSGNARMFVIGSNALQASLQKNISMLLSGLSAEAQAPVNYSTKNFIEERYQQRTGTKDRIVFAGLINQNSATGVFMNGAPLLTYSDTSREKLLQMLAAELFAGGGKQSVYTKTTGAGLSYSTGVGVSPGGGLFTYYAERTPLLPQTLGFVIDEIKKTPNDPAMNEYIISLSLSANRASGEYESRGEAMAADLADGLTPEKVRIYRRAILRLRKDPSLMTEVYKRKDAVYEKILPGYGAKMKDVPGGTYFVIGAEKQMASYESYLQSKEGPDTKLARIYPRDFWME